MNQIKNSKIMFLPGILAPLIYIISDIVCSFLYSGYSYPNQTISELSAIGAPTARIWNFMIFIFNSLLILFGLTIFKLPKSKFSLRLSGILISIWGFLGFVWLLFPMNQRGAIGSTSDTGHLIMAGLTVLLMVLFISFGSNAAGKWFRLYSILTVLIMLSFGAIVGTQAQLVAANLPTPGLGILERISVFSPMIWISVLSIYEIKDSYWQRQ